MGHSLLLLLSSRRVSIQVNASGSGTTPRDDEERYMKVLDVAAVDDDGGLCYGGVVCVL